MSPNDPNQTIAQFSPKALSSPFKWSDRILSRGGIAAAVNNLTRPKGPGKCDHNGIERSANIVTSLPFVIVGLETMRQRKTTAGRLYGGSIVGVGAASAMFHSSKGRWRAFARKVDYWACAVSATCLSKAVFPDMPPFVFGACLGLTPFCPFLVASANTLAMEIEYRKRSMNNNGLKRAHLLHNVCCCTGVTLFCMEDLKPHVPLSHAAWHLVSTVALSTTNNLLQSVEQTQKPRNGSY